MIARRQEYLLLFLLVSLKSKHQSVLLAWLFPRSIAAVSCLLTSAVLAHLISPIGSVLIGEKLSEVKETEKSDFHMQQVVRSSQCPAHQRASRVERAKLSIGGKEKHCP